ncbi:hypothetical protein ACQ4PT_063087 [Festuca glaucescens]
MAPRPPLVWIRGGLFLLVAVVLAQLGGLSCQTLRGSVACLDCPASHDLSGVVVAVQCRGVEGDSAAQTDGGGSFGVAMPEAPVSGCAARVLGGTGQLCAPQSITVARIVAGREPGSYALGSRLAVFTRCGALAATMAATGGGEKQPPPTTAPRLPSPPARSAPRVGRNSPPYGLGIPLIYVFPFIPIIGIP